MSQNLSIYLSILTVNMAFGSSIVSNRVPIYHTVYSKNPETLDSIKHNRLMTFNELLKRNLTSEKRFTESLFKDHGNIIYFDPNPLRTETANFAYFIDPETTYVYNREHRFFSNQRSYNGSRILLKDYLKNLEELQKMAQEPGTIKMLHPISGKPTLMPIKQYDILTEQEIAHEYIPEIIINRDIIPAEELIFLNDAK